MKGKYPTRLNIEGEVALNIFELTELTLGSNKPKDWLSIIRTSLAPQKSASPYPLRLLTA